jgi:phosphatidylinositol glycan class B
VDQFRLNAGLGDLDWSRFVLRWMLVLGGILTITAVVSLDFYQGDEHFQILEFVNYKLHRIPANLLPWEFHEQIRPWLQPAVYYLAAKAAMKVGLTDPFVLAAGFRLLSGFFAWVMLCSMMLLSYHLFSEPSRRRASVYLLSLLCFLPYMFVRTTSESWSTSFCLLGYAVLLLGSTRREGEGRDFPARLLFVVGLLWGLAFEFRVQTAFLIVGFILWMFFIASKDKLASLFGLLILLCGIFISVVLGTLIDWWGYGTLTFVPWNYFNQNVVNNVASNFGTLPWWGYFLLVNDNLISFVAIPLTIGTLIAWARFPKHSLTWGSLMYFLAHVAIAHKEARFMFALAVPAALLFVLAWTRSSHKETVFSRVWNYRRALVFRVAFVVDVAGLAFALTKHNVDLQFEEYAYYHLRAPFQVYVLKDSFTIHPFYERDYLAVTKVSSVAEIAAVPQGNSQAYLLTDGLYNERPGPRSGLKLSYVQSSLPHWVAMFDFFQWESRIKTWTLYRVDRQ